MGAVVEQAVVGVAHVDHCEVLSYLRRRCLVGLVRCVLSVLVERFARSLVWLGVWVWKGKDVSSKMTSVDMTNL